MKTMIGMKIAAGAVACVTLGITGCTSTQTGTAAGVGVGATVGAIVGNNMGGGGDDGNRDKGALIGAAVGGLVGNTMGRQADQQKQLNARVSAAEQASQQQTVWITNSNGSRTPVTLRMGSGGTWIGPKGETYTSMPTEAQLKSLYGL